MRQMRLTRVTAAWALLAGALTAQEVRPDVCFCAELESLPGATGVTPVGRDGAAGGQAAALDGDACLVWGLELPPGDYTLLLRGFAPAGDQDALFLICGAKRQRFTIPIGRWGQVALPFQMQTAGVATCRIDGQEAGVLVDRVGVVRGIVAEAGVDLAACRLTPMAGLVPLDRLPRVERPCRLAEFPPVGSPDDPSPLCREDFELPPHRGASGRRRSGQGRGGQGLLLEMPDGRFDLAVPAAPGLKEAGTVEWWVRPRPAAHAWNDQGWRFFLHAAPADGTTVQFDLARTVATGLTLTFSAGQDQPAESVSLDVSRLDPDEWHHLLVAWDFAGPARDLWLLVDGKGRHLHTDRSFPPCAFRNLGFGNSPPGAGLPFLPMDGALDQITVRAEPVRDRLAP